jgi:hypothetical protein
MLSGSSFLVVTDVNQSTPPIQRIGDKSFDGTERRAVAVGSNAVTQSAPIGQQPLSLTPLTPP